jgi:acetyl-CoA C-acetyltransferase
LIKDTNMRNVYITGIGQTPVGEHWDRSLIGLAVESLRKAQAEVPLPIDALYVANAYAGELGGQTQLGAAIAAAAGLDGVDALRIEAAGASGGVALRQAHLAVASGAYDVVAVVGVEKVTDVLDAAVEAALASALDADYEAAQGLTGGRCCSGATCTPTTWMRRRLCRFRLTPTATRRPIPTRSTAWWSSPKPC